MQHAVGKLVTPRKKKGKVFSKNAVPTSLAKGLNKSLIKLPLLDEEPVFTAVTSGSVQIKTCKISLCRADTLWSRN